uniref:Gliding motility lipoprotein GldH n=1 Tax=Roseihalotalea indica TaxID=2867963 RepID=A0AA49JGQ1_9BACT|nr:gliding motility lipoprotein GldH [Tunicatimonas sp. TK19036]
MRFLWTPNALYRMVRPAHFLTIAILFVIMSLIGCDGNRLYEQNVNFEKKAWAVDSLPVFRFQIENPEQPYNIYWNVRNTVAYPYRNLYLTYYLEDTLGNTIVKDLQNMELFESRTGKPYGSGLGDIFTHQILAIPNYQFDTAGMYQIRLQQYMRRDTLPEILSIGVRIEEAESN